MDIMITVKGAVESYTRSQIGPIIMSEMQSVQTRRDHKVYKMQVFSPCEKVKLTKFLAMTVF